MLGTTLLRKYVAAVKERNIQVEGHRRFSAGLPESLVDKWEKVCVLWENDGFLKKAENPFAINQDCEYHRLDIHKMLTGDIDMTETEVEKELEAEEEERPRSALD